MNDIRKVDTSAVAGGLVVLSIGVLMLVSRMTDLDFGDSMRRYWPMILVLVGLPKLFRRDTVWSGMWLITIGTWLQLANLRIFGLSYRNSWPLLLIAAGAGTILHALVDVIAPKEERHER